MTTATELLIRLLIVVVGTYLIEKVVGWLEVKAPWNKLITLLGFFALLIWMFFGSRLFT